MPIGLDDFRQEGPCLPRWPLHAERGGRRTRTWGVGSDQVAIFSAEPTQRAPRNCKRARLQRVRFDNGLAWITGPPEYGGRELPPHMSWRTTL